MILDFGRIFQMMVLKENFDDFFILLLLNRLSTKCQENEFTWCIVYILFREVIIMVKIFMKSSKMITIKL